MCLLKKMENWGITTAVHTDDMQSYSRQWPQDGSLCRLKKNAKANAGNATNQDYDVYQ